MLQYFNASWNEIAAKVPELAEAGYSSLWLPPPSKANGGYSVGYDLFDPFDLGNVNQRGTIATRYGTKADLHNLVELCHRFGIRVYFDNIMNHRAYDVPGYNETTPTDVFPGMVAEDFHLRKTSDGFYRKWDNTRDWNDAWQVLHLGLSDLLDIAHETPNQNFGYNEGDWHDKPSIVRHPQNPEFYDWHPTQGHVGFNSTSITEQVIAENPDYYKEDVGAYLCRNARWMMDTTKADGFRLDAVKHVPDYFFGAFGDDASDAGYLGQIQWQFNHTHGYSDSNHRDSNFNTEIPRDDALLFGEHLGQPPGYDGYVSAGMRLVDNDLRNQLNWRFSAGDLTGYDTAGAGGFSPYVGVMHAQSHDNDYVDRKELQHAYYFLRQGLGLLYTDGNRHAETLSGSGGAFPRWASTAFLGQWEQTHIPELLKIHENMARHDQDGMDTHWDGSVIAWERGGGFPYNTMLTVFNSNWGEEGWRTIPTPGTFPAGAYLYNYVRTYQCYFKDGGPAADYVFANDLYNVNQPPNSYSVWGYKNPDPSSLWPGDVVSIYDNGQLADTLWVERKDGPDGDAEFNPHNYDNRGYPTGVTPPPYTYREAIPRITQGTNVVFDARVDGSAYNVLMRLDGGMDLNGLKHNGDGDWRDNPPALSLDQYLGYEGVNFIQRIWPEKFAAANTANCRIGTQGATSYQVTIGQANMTNFPPETTNGHGTTYGELDWVYHNPAAMTDGQTNGSGAAFGPVTYANATTYGAFSTSDGGVYFNGTGEYNNNIGADAIGMWAGTTGFVQYVATFPSALGAGQTNTFDYQHNWIATDKSLGWALVDADGQDVLQLIYVGDTTSSYELRGNGVTNSTGIGWRSTAQSARLAFTSATNLTVTLNGTNNYTWTLAAPATKLRFWNWQAGGTSNHNYYVNDIAVDGAFPGGSESFAATNQYYLTATSVVVWAKTPKVGGTITHLYYTTNGMDWPEGAAGAGANVATRAAAGAWKYNVESAANSWWKFEFPKPANGAVLRYKIGAARKQGADGSGEDWEVVWPGDADRVTKKTLMLGEWATTNQNLKTKSFHKHNNYNSWTTNGLADGFHLITAKAFLGRNDGAAVFNTFRQTFYLDTETPQGYIQYPAGDGETYYGSEYGFIVRTDPTVREVWYHITDSNADNDGAGNGMVSGQVVWAQASTVGAWTEDMAEDTAYPQIWRFNYARIPATGTATIRVRLREWSSTASTNWSTVHPTNDNAAAEHYTELVRTLNTRGPAEEFFFEWPEADGAMVEAGWEFQLRYTAHMATGLSDQGIFDRVKVYVNASDNGSTNRGELVSADDLDFSHEWTWGSEGEGLNLLKFRMPNVYNGQDDWLYGVRVEFTNSNGYGTFDKAAVRLVRHRGPLLPTLIITTPPETDSDGAKYIIQMEDVPPSVLATNSALRQTPIVVLTDANATNLAIQFNSPTDYVGDVVLANVATNGDSLTWNHVWTVTNAGAYRFTATVWADTNGTELSSSVNSATRNATVQFRELVSTANTNDADWDDDGIVNTNEISAFPLPGSAPEYWIQGEVFNYFARGKTMENSPDTDGDGLPDGLELGYRWPAVGTATNTDTNGDGFPNFRPDLDPPFYNTLDNIGKVKGVDGAGTGADRTKLVQGSVTDPNNPDTDYDGIPDSIEDANRNGWVDGDGDPLPPDWDPYLERNWPDGVINSGEQWLETSPNVADSDGDGLSDGYGEDKNFNGYLDVGLADGAGNVTSLLANASVPKVQPGSRVIDRPALWAAYSNAVFLETCPLTADTDGDGLPDGWEVRYGLDPLDNGIISLRTGLAGNPDNGADGNPDGDTYLDGESVEQPYVNLLEYQNGTDPTVADSIADPGGEGAITIGQGPVIGVINGKTYYREFMDWTLDDLIALDNYNQGGNSSDIYRRGDGFDSSRDMVAFYFRDGGAADGKLYFRVDFDDLKANAEESALNIYVAINFGDYGTGEVNLPDQVNAGSLMKWNACIGVYDSADGVVYVDQDGNNNTTDIGGNLAAAGVEAVPSAFQGAYFNSELDAVAWSINRAALVTAGWNGNPDILKFQVYTTSDFTGDDGGSGDKGGLNDFTDTIGDDWLCSDYYQDYDYIAANGYYSTCVGRTAGSNVWNNMGQHAKVAMLAHGNQAVEPAVTIQNIVDNGSGAGYQRPVKIHNIYSNAALNLHITPTLAMALEWAKVGTSNTWYSGPGLNEQIRAGVAAGTFRLLGSTFSDHILPYFDAVYNLANVELATEALNEIYGGSSTSGVVSTNVFWIPERVADVEVLKQVKTNLGYRATILDQTPHLLEWYGREEALGNNAYKINRLWLGDADPWPSIDTFIIATAANNYRYVNTDSGLPTELRQLFNRRARSGADQISTIFYMWEDLSATANADAYDANLRWMANHPWIQVIALDEALDGEAVERNLVATNAIQSQDWVHHASNADYDNWYYGSDRHEGLAPKLFEVRIGTTLPSGAVYGSMTNGILSNAWKTVQGITNADVRRLAQQTLFASTFETAFHNETNSSLTRWSFGDYMYPAAGWQGLQGFAWKAQGQTRRAVLYAAVDNWARRALTTTEVVSADVDLDGEDEIILRNNAVMAIFERSGGRMVGAWLKTGANVVQMIGNFVSMPDSGTEDEGVQNVSGGGVGATRTSALKDWWDGSTNRVNPLHAFSSTANSVTFSNAGIRKTISLASASTNVFAVSYAMPGMTLRVRNGLSPDLDALLRTGQRNLAEEADGTSSLAVSTFKPSASLASTVKLAVATGSINTTATDMSNTWNTVNMRNQAQTRQVEVVGTNTLAFTIELASSILEANEPPVLEFTPESPYVMPVGATSTFTVAAIDYDSPSTTLSVTNLPVGGSKLATFDPNTGIFSWHVTALSQGGRTTDVVYTTTTFTADDGTDTTNAAVVITVPWDADADGMPDDWELLTMGTTTNGPDGDWDGDGFPNYSEWVASTDPNSPGSYIGWENKVVLSSNTVELTFQSVPGRTYAIEVLDGLLISTNEWHHAETIVSTNDPTTWVDTNALPNARNYRIKIPAAP
ncbi:MAG: alpha-amylase family glycosyl hydrolase [Kiritimatiellae bacterium]|nr:alpha-amylase family glycosyl hydrolase [Kiritimatiellia bacterium]